MGANEPALLDICIELINVGTHHVEFRTFLFLESIPQSWRERAAVFVNGKSMRPLLDEVGGSGKYRALFMR